MSAAGIPATEKFTAAQGIWATADAEIVFTPSPNEADQIDSTVHIVAENRTDSTIVLDQPYLLPARKAYIAEATAADGTKYNTKIVPDGIEIHFGSVKLEPHKKIDWTVKYSRRSDVYFDRILAYDRAFIPAAAFKEVPVRRHDFSIAIVLNSPPDERFKFLKKWRIHQRNTLNLGGDTKRGSKQTVFKLKTFHLEEKNSFELRLACVYDWGNWIWHALELALAALAVTAIEHGPALVIKIFEGH